MLVTLLPGANREHLLADLAERRNEITSLHSNPVDVPSEVLTRYVQWTTATERVLRRQVQSKDVERLVPSYSRDQLVVAYGSAHRETFYTLLNSEVATRLAAFNDAHEALRREIARWSATPGWLIVADTNIYLHGASKLKELDFVGLLNAAINGPTVSDDTELHVLVPIVVVDELDNLKQSKDRHVRWRARHTLSVLDSVFAAEKVAPLRAGVTMEMVLDPAGHVRLPITDDEIIDRSLAVSSVAGRPLTLLTYDTGMSTRARMAGLATVKVPDPPDGD
jgi:hypothetical protein